MIFSAAKKKLLCHYLCYLCQFLISAPEPIYTISMTMEMSSSFTTIAVQLNYCLELVTSCMKLVAILNILQIKRSLLPKPKMQQQCCVWLRLRNLTYFQVSFNLVAIKFFVIFSQISGSRCYDYLILYTKVKTIWIFSSWL